MKHQDVLEAERQRLEGEVCNSLKVIAAAGSRELGDFYTESFTCRGDQLRKLPYRVPEEGNDLAGAASILAQIGFMAFDLMMATEKVGDGSFAGKLEGATRESAVALGRVLLGEAGEGEGEAAEREEEGATLIRRAQLDEKAGRLLEVWAHAMIKLPDSSLSHPDSWTEEFYNLGYELREESPPDRGAYQAELLEIRKSVPAAGPGIPARGPRPEGYTEQRVLAPQVRHRRQVNAAAGILVEAYDQIHSLHLEAALDGPRGEVSDLMDGALNAIEELMKKVGQLLLQDGDAIHVGVREAERWIRSTEPEGKSLVVVNGSKE